MHVHGTDMLSDQLQGWKRQGLHDPSNQGATQIYDAGFRSNGVDSCIRTLLFSFSDISLVPTRFLRQWKCQCR